MVLVVDQKDINNGIDSLLQTSPLAHQVWHHAVLWTRLLILLDDKRYFIGTIHLTPSETRHDKLDFWMTKAAKGCLLE